MPDATSPIPEMHRTQKCINSMKQKKVLIPSAVQLLGSNIRANNSAIADKNNRAHHDKIPDPIEIKPNNFGLETGIFILETPCCKMQVMTKLLEYKKLNLQQQKPKTLSN